MAVAVYYKIFQGVFTECLHTVLLAIPYLPVCVTVHFLPYKNREFGRKIVKAVTPREPNYPRMTFLFYKILIINMLYD